jgi:hypothetical protein
MAAATITVTGKTGPALTVTAQQFTGVRSFTFTPGMLSLVAVDGRVVDVDIAAGTTCTFTVSGTTYTVTIT